VAGGPLLPSPAFVPELVPREPGRRDLAHLAAERLRRALLPRHDGAVLCDLLEEELRSALGGLESLRAHLEEVLSALLAERARPLDLLEAGDDTRAQAALAELEGTLARLRRRLAQAAAGVSAPGRTA